MDWKRDKHRWQVLPLRMKGWSQDTERDLYVGLGGSIDGMHAAHGRAGGQASKHMNKQECQKAGGE